MRNRAPFWALAALLAAAPLIAQDHADHHANRHPALPDGWMAHFDNPAMDHAAHGGDPGGLEFTDMPPGWHITTGPSGIFYQHDFRAGGSYTLETEIHLFDPGQRRESFGLFFGGSELHDREAQGYGYFLVRRDGRYMIRVRDGADLHDVQGWTEHEAIPSWDGRPEGAMTVPYTLTVEVGASEIVFRVNGTQVDRRPRGDLPVEGHYGLRVNHNLNLHITRVETR